MKFDLESLIIASPLLDQLNFQLSRLRYLSELDNEKLWSNYNQSIETSVGDSFEGFSTDQIY